MSRITLVLMFLVILIVFSATANAQNERFVGTFATTDANTRGVTRLSISADGQMHVWGRCHPIDCDWGVVPTDIYGPDVDANLQKSAKAVSAVYNPGFATKDRDSDTIERRQSADRSLYALHRPKSQNGVHFPANSRPGRRGTGT